MPQSSRDGHPVPPPSATSSWPRLVALCICGLEVVALIGYIVAVWLASRHSRGSSGKATLVEILIYLAFAVLIALIGRGILRRRPLARTPFLLAQLFVLVVGYTLVVGDGAAVKIAGGAVLAVGLVGLVVAFHPAFVASLDGEERSSAST